MMAQLSDGLFLAAILAGCALGVVVVAFRMWADWMERRRTAPWRNAEAFRRRLRGLAAQARETSR